jgi:hypothetical protein
MKLFTLACEVLARPLYLCAARSPHIVDIQLIERAQHNYPKKLRQTLQDHLDRIQGYDAVLLGYGLCGQAIAGLQARHIPLVVPRAHDCITLFLGNRSRYNQQFSEQPGTFWYALDYIERDQNSASALSMGIGSDNDLQAEYDKYVEKYGKENADYLMEVMGAWQAHYQRAVYIEMGVGDGASVEARARAEAERRGWAFERLEGDLVLLRRLLAGDWENDFLVVPPGGTIKMAADEGVIRCPEIDPGS